MSVKGPTKKTELDQQLRVVMPLMGRVFRGLKRGHANELPSPFRELFASTPLGQRHVPVLITLTLQGPMSVTELTETLGLKLATTSLMVSELSQHELVLRQEDTNDRRRTLVQISKQHSPAIKKFIRHRSEPMRRTLERMDPTAREHFIEGWKILADEVAELPKHSH